MSKPIITVDNLSKSYLVGHQSGSMEHYTALRDLVGRHVKNFARKGLDMLRGRQIVQGDEIEEFWALKNVSFEIVEGDVVGIIGKNGAGKSTLLKILSRITEPTSGRVTLRGRIASLLEVGTGFHPELTGRENIFLNGAILGMKRSEIKSKFDEIVDFSGVEKFIDTPVKRFSSGMYVRLAFAVAAHLEPDVLIIDEVLAVGDGKFQKRCMEKISQISRGDGSSVLVVSHDLNKLQSLCKKAILLDCGQIKMMGTGKEAVAMYRNLQRDASHSRKFDSEDFSLLSFEANPSEFTPITTVRMSIMIEAKKKNQIFDIHYYISDGNGNRVALIDLRDAIADANFEFGSRIKVETNIKRLGLTPGTYSVGICLRSTNSFTVDPAILLMDVVASDRIRDQYQSEYLGPMEIDATNHAMRA